MNIFFEKITRATAKTQVWFNQATVYISVFNMVALGVTVNEVLGLGISNYLIVPVLAFLALFVGYVDYRFLLLPRTEYANKKNDIRLLLDEINEKK